MTTIKFSIHCPQMTDFKKAYQILLISMIIALLFSCASASDEKEPFWIETASALMSNGIAHYNNQQFFLAKKDFLKALNAYQRFNDVEGMAQCQLNLAKTHISTGENAEQYIDRLHQLINENNLSKLRVHADIMRASVMIKTGLYDNAEEILGGYVNKPGLQKDVYASVLINRLRVAFAKNNQIDQWLKKYEFSIEKNNKLYNARLLRFKAQYAHINKNKEKSDQLFEQALIKYRLLANSKGVFFTLKEWGDALILSEDWVGALAKYNNALITARSTGIKNDIEVSQKAIARLKNIVRNSL